MLRSARLTVRFLFSATFYFRKRVNLEASKCSSRPSVRPSRSVSREFLMRAEGREWNIIYFSKELWEKNCQFCCLQGKPVAPKQNSFQDTRKPNDRKPFSNIHSLGYGINHSGFFPSLPGGIKRSILVPLLGYGDVPFSESPPPGKIDINVTISLWIKPDPRGIPKLTRPLVCWKPHRLGHTQTRATLQLRCYGFGKS